MTINKKARSVLLLVFAAMSILPGCGKKNDAAVVNGVGGVAQTYQYSTAGLTGNCYNFGSYSAGQGASVTFQGSGYVDPYTGVVRGSVIGASISFGGANYSRTNVAGDNVQVYVSGNTMQAVANLAPNTVDWFRWRGLPLCGMNFNSYTSGGNMSLSAQFVSYNNNAITAISL